MSWSLSRRGWPVPYRTCAEESEIGDEELWVVSKSRWPPVSKVGRWVEFRVLYGRTRPYLRRRPSLLWSQYDKSKTCVGK